MDGATETASENEGTYEYACMRAELLGIEKPDFDEFMKNKQEKETKAAEEEEIDTELIKEAEHQSEGLKGISGGLDELNNILQSTQKRITRFKQSCGSLTSKLKIKIGSVTGGGGSTEGESVDECTGGLQSDSTEICAEEKQQGGEEIIIPRGPPRDGTERKSDLTKALDKHVNHLDSLIDKAENAQYSMAHQNKQMKKFLD